MNTTTCLPPVHYTLTAGGPFDILLAFHHAAQRAGWNKQQINDVIKDCLSSDYSYLQNTVAKYCIP